MMPTGLSLTKKALVVIGREKLERNVRSEHFDSAIHAAQLGRPSEQRAVNGREVRP